jgi:Lon protease-like protein
VALPETLPFFPDRVLLLPGTFLPLRLRATLSRYGEDTLGVDRIFGMIQPFTPQPDNRPLPGAEQEKPDLYKVGCAGYIEKWEKLPEGRFFVELRGVNRFRLRWNFRCVAAIGVKADYHAFPDGSFIKAGNGSSGPKALAS